MHIFSSIDRTWTLFLDRDGVINEEKENDYVYSYKEFKFLPGVFEALKILSKKFERIILVTNQRGVGRGLMNESELIKIHDSMLKDIELHKGRIDKIYYCTINDNAHPNRKPNPGMAFQAVKDNPEIDLEKSIMVGNNLSDMHFGRKAGMKTVHLYTTQPEFPSPHELIDYSFPDLLGFAKALEP